MSDLKQQAHGLGLHGLLIGWDELSEQDLDVVRRLVDWEETERQRRSLERRIRNARIGRFKPLADFDWSWPESLDRAAVEELFTFQFL